MVTDLSPALTDLIQKAKEARLRAYAPYSGFLVGTALLCSDGTVFRGCNVENASFGATICAERSAACAAVASGYTSFSAIAIVADTETLCSPCGICRQFLAEFGLGLTVVLANLSGAVDVRPLSAWLPGAFTSAELERGRT